MGCLRFTRGNVCVCLCMCVFVCMCVCVCVCVCPHVHLYVCATMKPCWPPLSIHFQHTHTHTHTHTQTHTHKHTHIHTHTGVPFLLAGNDGATLTVQARWDLMFCVCAFECCTRSHSPCFCPCALVNVCTLYRLTWLS